MADRYIKRKTDCLPVLLAFHLAIWKMAVHLPWAMFVGFLSFGHNGYLLSFIQHLAAASFALENLHCCGTYVFALTVWLFVRFLLINAAASFILSKPTVSVCQIEQCQRLQNRVSTSLVVVFPCWSWVCCYCWCWCICLAAFPFAFWTIVNCRERTEKVPALCWVEIYILARRVRYELLLHLSAPRQAHLPNILMCLLLTFLAKVYVRLCGGFLCLVLCEICIKLCFFSLFKTHPKALNLHFDRSGQST